MDLDSDDDGSNRAGSPARRNQLLDNEMRSFRNRGFHDGYDDGKKAAIQDAFDSGYKKAFEQSFILSTLKGVASALKSSCNLNRHQTSSPTALNTSSAATSAAPSPVLSSTSSASSTTSSSATAPNSSNYISILESMKFDDTSDIESIKNDLIKICRDNRLDILAHYVSQIR